MKVNVNLEILSTFQSFSKCQRPFEIFHKGETYANDLTAIL